MPERRISSGLVNQNTENAGQDAADNADLERVQEGNDERAAVSVSRTEGDQRLADLEAGGAPEKTKTCRNVLALQRRRHIARHQPDEGGEREQH
jgi:hypothetical protein